MFVGVVEDITMAATVAHCQQLIDKLRVLSVSDDAAKIEQVTRRCPGGGKRFVWQKC